MKMPEYDSADLVGILATKDLGEVLEHVAKLQAEIAMGDLVDTEFDNPDFWGGMAYLTKIIQLITLHALAAGPGMRMEVGTSELAGFIGHLLVTFVNDLDDLTEGKPVHVPDKGVSVVAWGDIGGR